MPTILTTPAIEQGTFAAVAAFTDDAGDPVVPNADLTWSLYKKVSGVETVVNGRDAVAIDSAASVTIVLKGDDLALVTGESKSRWLLIEGSYDSDLGENLPLKDTMQFSIVNLVGVS